MESNDKRTTADKEIRAHDSKAPTPPSMSEMADVANAVGSIFKHGVSAVREVNAAHRAHVEARDKLDALDERIAVAERDLERRRDVEKNYDKLVAEYASARDAAQKDASAARVASEMLADELAGLEQKLKTMIDEDAETEKRLKEACDEARAREKSAAEALDITRTRLEEVQLQLDAARAQRERTVTAAKKTLETASADLQRLKAEYAEIQRNPSANSAAYSVKGEEIQLKISDAAAALNKATTDLPRATEMSEKTIAAAEERVAEARKPVEEAEAAYRDVEIASEQARASLDAARKVADRRQRSVEEDIAALQAPAKEAAQAANQAAETATETNQSVTEAEVLRVTAEQARAKAETARAAAETERVSKETARQTAETARIEAEIERATKETERQSAEQLREEAEAARAETEESRTEAEAERQSQEEIRQANETKRQTDTAAAITEAKEATQEATATKELTDELNAHPMKPEGGYWWAWNTETKAYENTGIQAKGDVGASFKIVGRYDTLEELQRAIPDGTDVDGVYAVGSEEPFSYYAWVVVDGVYRWDNQGQLQGAEGKSAYEVWLSQPGNEGKTEAEYLAWLAPEIDPETGRWTVQGRDTDQRALPFDAKVTEDGGNTEKIYRLNIETAEGAITTPNLRGTDGEKYTVPTLDHEPTETDLAWTAEDGSPRAFEIGYMCRWLDPDRGDSGEYLFYQLNDITKSSSSATATSPRNSTGTASLSNSPSPPRSIIG